MAQDVYRDGVNVLWCRSHLVWLVFEGSIPTCACFPLDNFLVTFVIWSRNVVEIFHNFENIPWGIRRSNNGFFLCSFLN